ncbi:MAG: hypothetical protein IK082_06380 [Oscillospiraceae bacterium]|nr:hypothetical protein [Oscillospiraceae bacterium]
MDLPIKIGIDEYCRADSKLLMAYEDEVLYIGFSPDGENPGRRCAARISALEDGAPVPYTCEILEGKVLLHAEKGHACFAVGKAEELVITGRSIGLAISNGKALNTFMGGGNAVTDARGGALFAIAGVRMRFLPRKGTAVPDSHWDFNYLCDPDPKLYLLPDADGTLETAVFAAEREESAEDRGLTADQAAEDLTRDFAEYAGALGIDTDRRTAARAAWALWNCRQPPRPAYELGLEIKPAVIRGRRSSGSLFAEDYALSALAEKDTQVAMRLMLLPFAAIQPDGFLPSELANHKLRFTATPPLYGVVLASRKDIMEMAGDKEYELLKRALMWWINRRYCDRHDLFFCEHRTENGRPEPVPFLGLVPVMTPDLNAYLVLWLRKMTALADKLGRSPDADAWRNRERLVLEGMRKHLLLEEGYRCLNIAGTGTEGPHSGSFLAEAVASDGAMPDGLEELRRGRAYAAEYLALYGGTSFGRRLAETVLAEAEDRPIPDLRCAVTCLLADRALTEGR